MIRKHLLPVLTSLALCFVWSARGTELVEGLPLTDRVLMLHFNEGHVIHHQGKGEFHPGIIPYGPWRKEKAQGQGPWDVAWPHQTVYPPIDSWPGNERWFDNRCSPMNSEFTVH